MLIAEDDNAVTMPYVSEVQELALKAASVHHGRALFALAKETVK